MTDYFSATVIEPFIPISQITPFERLLLENMFSHKQIGDQIYFFTPDNVETPLRCDRATLDHAIRASTPHYSSLLQTVAEHLETLDPDCPIIDLNLSAEPSWEQILQDIIRRSETIDYFSAVTSFTCGKMRVDAFGGMVVLITANEVRGKSTNDVLDELMSDAKVGCYAPAQPENNGALHV
jgi:hypothetical protein